MYTLVPRPHNKTVAVTFMSRTVNKTTQLHGSVRTEYDSFLRVAVSGGFRFWNYATGTNELTRERFKHIVMVHVRYYTYLEGKGNFFANASSLYATGYGR